MSNASFATADGLAQRVYDNFRNLQAECAIITKRSPIDASIKNVGEGYYIPVLVKPPNGVTFIGNSPTYTSLLAGRPMEVLQAVALPYEMDLQENTPWAVFSRLDAKSEASAESYMAILISSIQRVMSTRHEASVLMGQTSLGTVSAVAGSAGAATITFTAATFRPGFWWAVGPGATFDFFTSTTKNNATGPFVLTGVSSTAYTITGTCSGTLGSEIASGDVCYQEGAWDGSTFSEMPGLISQASTSGTSMGIDNTAYVNWASNSASVGGSVTPDVLEVYFGQLRNRMQEGKLTAYMPENTWRSILAQVQSLRYLDSSYSADNQKVGAKSVTISTAQFSNVELCIHPMLANGEMYIQCDAEVKRVGSREPQFGIPNSIVPGNKELLMITGTNSATAYGTADAGVINKAPANAYYLSGITVS